MSLVELEARGSVIKLKSNRRDESVTALPRGPPRILVSRGTQQSLSFSRELKTAAPAGANAYVLGERLDQRHLVRYSNVQSVQFYSMTIPSSI